MSVTTQQRIELPPYRFGPSQWEDLSAGISREWLITNGIGGYASSTLIGANTRRYHGLLVASVPAPSDRQLLLSKIEEEIGEGETFYQLSTNSYRDSVFPTGYRYLTSFSQAFFPTWLYQLPAAGLKKWIFLKRGENTVVVAYQLIEATAPIRLYLRLLMTNRNAHHLLRADSKKFEQEISSRNIALRAANNGAPILYVTATSGTYHPDGQWYYNFQYAREKERGLDFEEDLFCPGSYAFTLSPGETVYLVASTDRILNVMPSKWQVEEEERLSSLLSQLPERQVDVQALGAASDAFVTRKNSLSVIAGYPWLSDWGRDTLISVPGLFLVTGRVEEAKRLLEGYAARVRDGLIPNSFHDFEIEELKEINRQVRQDIFKPSVKSTPSLVYQSADGPLWLFYAVYKTFLYSKDSTFVERMLPALESIIQAYMDGTHFSIGVGGDLLLYAGSPDIPVTWMDAKVGHLVVTPRNGAAVEVNALWYNALKTMETLSPSNKQGHYSQQAEKFLTAFRARFWNPASRMLYDCVSPNGSDATLRPNQIFALSLPFRLLPKEQEDLVMQKVTSHLYTPFGLRTLDSADPNYKGTYQGDRWLRDRALHQGTAWPWLLGPYMTALVNVEGEKARPKILDLLSPILAHLQEAGIGTISEIFWGDFPHKPCGCIAKAWSVAEVLRAYVEDGLGIKP